ncbi:MAG: glycosyltransferase family 2 protein, partial [Candidatus Omnitrophica bacterium]|nr:glycosyltransferase family 2 protein [Candidatus Omnitrophota bacterium]
LKFGIAYMVVMECLTALQGIISLVQSRHGKVSLLLSTFLTQPYRVFLSYTRIVAFSYELKNKRSTW